jgi:hypothetical protein
MVEAEGVGIFRVIENTKVTEKSTRPNSTVLQNRDQLERIWNTGLSLY